MPTCKQMIDLASTSLEAPMPRWQRWQFHLHLLLCRHCRRYLKQLRFLQQASVSMRTQIENVALSEEARERIAKKLQSQQHTGQ